MYSKVQFFKYLWWFRFDKYFEVKIFMLKKVFFNKFHSFIRSKPQKVFAKFQSQVTQLHLGLYFYFAW